MSSFLDSRLLSLEAYVPGEQPKPGEFIKLNTNEFPYPPAEGVKKATAEAVETMNLYSDLNCTLLKSRFNDVYGFGRNNVIFTNGSDEALYLCFLAFCGDKGAAFADLTYGFYSVYADLCGIKKNIIPLQYDFSIKPADYFNLTETIFIANPNAPTGIRLSNDDIEQILLNNKNNIVVIDEAYTDFSGETCKDLVDKYNNLIVVGTFSKSRGMAGARLGYIITNAELVKDIETVKYSINPYNVNSLTQATGAAVLENNDYYLSKIEEICNTRDDFQNKLIELGFDVIPSKTNFVFTKHRNISGKYIAEELRKSKILIRRFDKKRIEQYLRISIGTPDEMNIVISELKKIVGDKNENI